MDKLPEKEYVIWLQDIKSKIHSAQIKAVLSAQSELIQLYWYIGKSIVQQQKKQNWGSAVVERLSKDLSNDFPDMTGFSRTNLFAMRQFYTFYEEFPHLIPQLVGQIPWGHNRLILGKVKNHEEALFYIRQTIENGWSRNILGIQIESNLFKRQGKAITNFKHTLLKPQSDLANQTLKDPYIFDFLTLQRNAEEKELELQLLKHITQFLLELGKGFAFIGQQYKIEISNKTYRIDLLFYHVKLRCYVVIELKTGEFEPEFAGKMNFYLSAIDDKLKDINDNPSIGILLCKTRDKVEVEYALRDIGKPIGVSEFLIKEIPFEIKSELPTIEEIENELREIN